MAKESIKKKRSAEVEEGSAKSGLKSTEDQDGSERAEGVGNGRVEQGIEGTAVGSAGSRKKRIRHDAQEAAHSQAADDSTDETKPEAEDDKALKAKRKHRTRKDNKDGDDQTKSSHEEQLPSVSETESPGAPLTMYVSGFPYDTDIEQYVRSNTSGVVDVRVHTWHDTGRSRGCAHADYATEKEFKAALSRLHKATVGSRYIEAVKANDKGPELVAPSEAEDQSRGGRRLYVGNLPYDVTENTMREFFTRFGAVAHVRIPQWNHTENKKGFGYVQFEQKSFAVDCMQRHRSKPLMISGRTLKLDYDQGRPKRGFKDEKGRAWYKPKQGDRNNGKMSS